MYIKKTPWKPAVDKRLCMKNVLNDAKQPAGFENNINIAQTIVNSNCLMAGKLSKMLELSCLLGHREPILVLYAQLVMEGLELWQKNSEFFVQKSVIS